MDNVIVKLSPYIKESSINTNFNVMAGSENIPTGISIINAPAIWRKGITGKGVKIAVIDTGCDTKHADLVGQIIGGRNFTTEDNSNPNIYEDYNGHGTHVCGTIAAKSNNIGLIGVAPDAKLLVLKVLTKNGTGTVTSVINAINYAVSQKVNIISMSLGAPTNVPELYTAVKTAVDNNILVVCAAGNSGDNNALTNENDYPSAYNEVISVGAVDSIKRAAVFTNSNNQVDLVAPGVQINSTYMGNSYRILSGTSMATPHITGALALLIEWSNKEWNRALSETEIYAQLIKNTINLRIPRTIQGNGLLYLNI